MVSLEQPRALAAGAINPLDSMSASAICCGVYLRYGARSPALTSSAMLSFLSFFEVAKVSNVLINSDCSTPYVRAMPRFSFPSVMLLLPVGLCTSRLALRGPLSGPRGRSSGAQLALGGVHTMPSSSARAGERCRPSRSPSKALPARRDPAADPVMLAWRSAGRARHLRYLRVLRPLGSFLDCLMFIWA